MKRLVAYFSTGGTTRSIANKLQSALGSDIYEIRPAIPYTKKDLDWTDSSSRTSVEMSNPASRPELSDRDAHVEDYDVILLGFPIWWYREPSVIDTFLESYDFKGRTICVFATSGSVGLGDTEERIRKITAGEARVFGGRRFLPTATETDLKRWIEYLGI